MPALRRTQQIASAANLQIAQRQPKPRTQRAVLLHGGQPLPPLFVHMSLIRQQQVGIGLMRGTSHTPAQLVQIRQTKPVGAMNENGIGARNVEAALHNRGAEQHIAGTALKIAHNARKLPCRHLSVRHSNPCLRHQSLQSPAHQLNGKHAVIEKKDLTFTIELLHDSRTNHGIGVARNARLHGQTLLWRGLQQTHVAGAGHALVERARNRRGRERQHIHQLPHMLEILLVRHAEALLLVDHQQPEVLEHHTRLQQRMRADHDIHGAGSQRLERALTFGRGAEAAQHFDAHRIGRHALAERFKVLLCQNRGGDQHSDLLAVHHRNECCAHGDLGLAVTGVAANQAVHGARRGHVLLHLGNHLLLIRGLAVREGRLKRIHPGRIRVKGKAGLELSPRLGLEQRGRQVANGALRIRLFAQPALPAQFVQRRRLTGHANIAAEQMTVRHGYMQPRAVSILQRQHLQPPLVHLDLGGAGIAPDAMINMHHQITGNQFRQRFHA